MTNEIQQQLVRATAARYLKLRARFKVRGGIYTDVTVEHRQPGWQAPAPVALP